MRRTGRTTLHLGGLTLALALVACGGGDRGGGAEPSDPTATPGEQTLTFQGDPALAALESMPTQDEVDARVAETIDDSNADAAYEALRAELASDPDAR